MGNPFADVAWETTNPDAVGGILPEGNHLVTIDKVDGTGLSSGGHPQIEVEASNDQGQIRDWMVTIPSAAFRPAALFAACGLEKPTEKQWLEEGTGFRLDPKYLEQCVGKTVGVIVREEPSWKDPTKMRSQVKGWCTPEEIEALKTDLPADTEGLGNGKAPGSAPDDDIPF
jgi:hypothetical protein